MPTTRPTKLSDGDFNEFSNRFISQVIDNEVKWKVDKEWLEGDVSDHLDEWNETFAQDQNPMTKNKLSTARKNAARKELEADLHKLIEFLRGNIHVSDDDERELGIYIAPHDTHPTPTTTKSPEIRVELNHIRRVTGSFHIEGSDDRGKPDGVGSVQMAHGFAQDDEEVTIKKLIHQNLDLYSRNSFMLEFDDEDRGKTVYMAARYVMKASASGYGPWSEICFAIIP
jgi:hypothetical protein